MSMSYYSDQGWGIELTDTNYNADGIRRCIMKAPELYADILDTCKVTGNKFEDLEMDDLRDMSGDIDGTYIAENLIALAMLEVTGLSFMVTEDRETDQVYLMFPALFPWQFSYDERNVKKDTVEQIITEWYQLLDGSDVPAYPEFIFVDCVNWG